MVHIHIGIISLAYKELHKNHSRKALQKDTILLELVLVFSNLSCGDGHMNPLQYDDRSRQQPSNLLNDHLVPPSRLDGDNYLCMLSSKS
jgi:hypothetical protein